MRHNKAAKRLSRTDAHRRALLRNLTTSFLLHGKVETTSTKAKEISKIAERILTTARRGDLHARRQIASYLLDPKVVQKVCDHIAPTLKDRSGGYTRVLKVGIRRGDAAEMSLLELVTG